MNTERQINRDRKTGQYAEGFEAMCKCGHTKGNHLAGGEKPCALGPHGDFCAEGTRCECTKFKKGAK